MEFYTILIYILRRFSGFVFVVISITHGILVVLGVGLPHTRGLGAEEEGEPDGTTHPASAVYHAIFIVVYAVFGGGGGGDSK